MGIAGLLIEVSNSVTDHFAVLGQPRRPWLDLDQLKQQYQQMTLDLHPDRPKTNAEASDFSAVTDAYRVLSNPRLRLRHLLDLNPNESSTTRTSDVPAELTDTFMEAATLVREIDVHRKKLEQTGGVRPLSFRSELMKCSSDWRISTTLCSMIYGVLMKLGPEIHQR